MAPPQTSKVPPMLPTLPSPAAPARRHWRPSCFRGPSDPRRQRPCLRSPQPMTPNPSSIHLRSSCSLRTAGALTLTACTASSSAWRALLADADTDGPGSPPLRLPLLPPAAAPSAIVDCTNAQARVRACARACSVRRLTRARLSLSGKVWGLSACARSGAPRDAAPRHGRAQKRRRCHIGRDRDHVKMHRGIQRMRFDVDIGVYPSTSLAVSASVCSTLHAPFDLMRVPRRPCPRRGWLRAPVRATRAPLHGHTPPPPRRRQRLRARAGERANGGATDPYSDRRCPNARGPGIGSTGRAGRAGAQGW